MSDAACFTAADRKLWLAALARAGAEAMRSGLEAVPPLPPHVVLRGPEIGLAMVRGRAGGGGAAFNLGEMTVTRCTVRAGGQIGHAWRAGRDTQAAELAARLDAALQDSTLRPALLAHVIAPLQAADSARRDAIARRAAATRVEFFTMATMRS